MRKLITIFTILFLFCETGCTSTTTETTALNDINIEKIQISLYQMNSHMMKNLMIV